MRSPRSVVSVALLAVLLGSALTGCRSEDATGDESAATLQRVAGTDRFQVTLSQHAVQRLAVTTARVRSATGSLRRGGVPETVPYAAVVYDSDGSTWAYIEAAPRTYVRWAIVVDSIVGGTAYLRSGPPVGTPVVVVGAPELLGAEYQIAGEE